MEFKQNKQRGYIMIVTLVLLAIVTLLVASLVGYTRVQILAHRQAVNREKTLDIAEAGAEAAIWKLNNQSGYTGEANTSYGGGTYTVVLTNLSNLARTVKVDAYFPNSTSPLAHRTIQLTANIGTKNFGFSYGVQVGGGGLIMDNNSKITGNVYSDGNIVGGNNGATITGDAIVAGSTGSISNIRIAGNSRSHNITNSTVTKNANHYALTSTQVTGNASVNSLAGPSCSVGGTAAYNTRSNCTVTGTITTPNSNVPTDPGSIPLPIDTAQVAAWESEAASGGSMPGQTLTGTRSLGPIKVNGDLTLDGTITMTGTIWVTGNLVLNNGSAINLSSNYGSLSGEIIVGTAGTTTNGYINISNGATITGSGSTGSYVMLLSERDTKNNSNVAITASNNVAAAILYANDGLVEVVNNATLKEITSWKLHLNNQTNIVYDAGYASAEFTTGPTGGWEIAPQSWQLLR